MSYYKPLKVVTNTEKQQAKLSALQAAGDELAKNTEHYLRIAKRIGVSQESLEEIKRTLADWNKAKEMT